MSLRILNRASMTAIRTAFSPVSFAGKMRSFSTSACKTSDKVTESLENLKTVCTFAGGTIGFGTCVWWLAGYAPTMPSAVLLAGCGGVSGAVVGCYLGACVGVAFPLLVPAGVVGAVVWKIRHHTHNQKTPKG